MIDENTEYLGDDIDPETGNFKSLEGREEPELSLEQIALESGFKNLTDVINFLKALQNDYDIDVADYDADFSGDIPYFINIWSHDKGSGCGFNVFLNFLERVGLNNEFNSTDFTESGRGLFNKAVNEGLIAQQSGPKGLNRATRWRVIKDPIIYRKERILKVAKLLNTASTNAKQKFAGLGGTPELFDELID